MTNNEKLLSYIENQLKELEKVRLSSPTLNEKIDVAIKALNEMRKSMINIK